MEGNRIFRMVIKVEVDFESLEYQKRIIKASSKKKCEVTTCLEYCWDKWICIECDKILIDKDYDMI